MTYSAAIFANSSDTLEQAQQRKYQRVMELLRPNANDQVLEIGCGWGGFGAHLLHHSRARWHGVTLSAEQLDWTLARIDKHRQRASAALCDYRDLDRRYDHIVSIEMLEAVGEANWPCYFERLRSLLKPGGRAVIQTITIADERFEAYRQSTDYIQRYIFPGGMLPCPAMIHRHIEQAGLRLLQEEAFGDHYAQTLAHWHKAFCGAWSQIEALGFDQRFKRLWQYYLAYCESGFKAGSIDVRFYQITTEH